MVAIEDTRKSKTSLWRSLRSHRRRPFLDIFHSILSFSLLEQEENSLVLVDFLLYSIGLQISKRIQGTIDVSKRYVRFKKKRKEKKSENEKRFERKNFRRGIKLPLWEHGGAWRQGSSDFYRDDSGGNNASYHQLLHVPPRTPTRAPSLRMHTRNAGIARVLHGFREGRWEFNKLRRVFRPRLLSFRAVAARHRDTERRIFGNEDAPSMVDSLKFWYL